jgi:hypothetical protein
MLVADSMGSDWVAADGVGTAECGNDEARQALARKKIATADMTTNRREYRNGKQAFLHVVATA